MTDDPKERMAFLRECVERWLAMFGLTPADVPDEFLPPMFAAADEIYQSKQAAMVEPPYEA